MNSRRVAQIVSATALIVLVSAIPAAAGSDRDPRPHWIDDDWVPKDIIDLEFFDSEAGDCLALGGAWMGSDADGVQWFGVMAPTNADGSVLVFEGDFINPDPSMGGLIPEARRLTGWRGEIHRSSATGGEYIRIGAALDAAGAPVAIIVAAGSFETTDCSTVSWNGTTAVYDAQQDPFGEEEPMYGFVSLDERAVSTRLVLEGTEAPQL
jgi:hypothetical protein